MVHLVIHLALEVKITGPVQYRWMYPIERYLRKLKSYVRNLSCPEGSIAETYIANECLQSCSLYMEGGDSRSYWTRKSKDDTKHEIDKEGCLFPTIGKSYGSVEVIKLDQKTWVQTHRYVLFNCESDVVDYYKNEHISEIKRLHRKRRLTQHQLNRLHFENSHEWFKEQVKELDLISNISNDVKALAQGPCYFARRFKAFHMNNGYRFRTKQYEKFMQTQNSGVLVVSMTESYAIVLFKCDWVDVTQGRGVMKDDLGFTLGNFSHLIHSGDRISDEPFVFAGQAQQVIFVQDPEDHEWFVPRSIKP
ncbi:hypothetical protein KY285_011254 [Solanum tuberosum]|nr:hypothetical protein KY285_011254 [Solanum tuberosum]